MNIKNLKKYEIFSIFLIFVLGTFLHFTFNLSGQNNLVSIFSPVNESVWEHLKLLFFPMLLSTLIGCIYFRKTIPNFLCSKTIGIIISLIFIVVFFYTYTGILGKNISAIDISSFFISTILGELTSYLLIINKIKCNKLVSIIILVTIFISFIVSTFNTPEIGIFKDPVTNKYGITN